MKPPRSASPGHASGSGDSDMRYSSWCPARAGLQDSSNPCHPSHPIRTSSAGGRGARAATRPRPARAFGQVGALPLGPACHRARKAKAGLVEQPMPCLGREAARRCPAHRDGWPGPGRRRGGHRCGPQRLGREAAPCPGKVRPASAFSAHGRPALHPRAYCRPSVPAGCGAAAGENEGWARRVKMRGGRGGCK